MQTLFQILGAICLVLLTACGAPELPASGSGGINSPEQRSKPYLILISLDGFRWDYQDLNPTPGLDRIAQGGVRADAMVPVFPTLTFPNHYSIATGLYPARHGLRGNTFASPDRKRWYSLRDRAAVQDGSWYAGSPIWVTAERAGMVSAAFFFVGTEADIGGVRPTHWNQFDASIPNGRRVDQVLQWLSLPAERRPHLITLYFEEVDSQSHDYGPGSPEARAAIAEVDRQLLRLLDGVEALPLSDEVYFVVVSDHGQASYDSDEVFVLEDVVDLAQVDVVDHGAAAFVYLKDGGRSASSIRDDINARWRNGRAWLPGEAPASWHLKDGLGFADVIVQAQAGHAVLSSRRRPKSNSIGDHGWAPDVRDMHGIFLAMGPRLPAAKRIPAINAVDVYPLMLAILDLPYFHDVDGNRDTLVSLLE